jgi:glycine cleavage system H protein
VFVELPEVGREVAAGEAVAVVESVKTASDIYAPAAGTVTEVNTALEASPEAINSEPYEGGWMFRLRVTGEDALSELLSAEAYEALQEQG